MVLVVSFLGILAPTHLMAISGIIHLRNFNNHNLVRQLGAATTLSRVAIDDIVERWRANLAVLAGRIAAAPPAPAELMSLYRRQHTRSVALALLAADGSIVAQSGRARAAASPERFRQAAAGAGEPVSLPNEPPEPGMGRALFGLAVPVGMPDGRRLWLAELREADDVQIVLDLGGWQPGWAVQLLDRQGRLILAGTRTMQRAWSDANLAQAVQALPRSGADNPARRVPTPDGALYVASAAARTAGWQVVAVSPASYADATPTDLVVWLLLGSGLLVPLGVSLLLGGYIERRSHILAEAARAVSSERRPQPMPPSGIREIDAIQRALLDASQAVEERAEARLRVRETTEALDRAQRMEGIGQMMAGVAHDFGSLVFVIGGNLEALQRSLPQDAPEQSMVAASLRMANEAATLVGLLSTAARERRREPVRVNLNTEIDEMTELLRSVAGRAITITVSPGQHLMSCRLDPLLLRSALLNLVINARTAMPKGGEIRIVTGNAVLGKAEAAAKGVHEGSYVAVSVSDTGSGIPPELRRRIFEPFFTTRRGGPGNGFGLSVIHGFVTALGGHVEVDGAIGKGTRFTLYLPAAQAA